MLPLPEFNSWLVPKRPTTGFRLGTITSCSVPQQSSSISVSCGVSHISIPHTVQVWLTSVTDRQTDRQTDQIAIAIAECNTSDERQKLGNLRQAHSTATAGRHAQTDGRTTEADRYMRLCL